MSQLRLSELLRRDVASDPEITAVTADSRQVVPGAWVSSQRPRWRRRRSITRW
jgi:hypothetical protein